MAPPVLIIANPVSGAGRGRMMAERLAQSLERLGIGTRTCLTTLERHGGMWSCDVEPDAYRALAVVGGDGSINDVIGGLRARATPIAVLPAGTANVWAREARIPSNPAAAAALIAAGRSIDVVLGTANGEPFVLFAGAGLDARLVRRVEELRAAAGHTGGMLRWIRPGLAELLRPQPALSVTVDGRRLDGAQILVTRVRSYAAFLRLPRGIDIADGQLHVLVFPPRGLLGLLALGCRALLGRLREGRDVMHLRTTAPVRIESRGGPEPFHRDGDDAGDLPLEVALSGVTVRLIVP